ncbi:MAG: hypothetical protein IJH37_08485 [Clostridia bacterium]|nr:hypothetical protein [Clostridia bacterium]
MFPNLEAEQKKAGLTDQMAADKIGLSKASFKNKKRTGKFYIQEIFNLCNMFKCKFEYLFVWQDDN